MGSQIDKKFKKWSGRYQGVSDAVRAERVRQTLWNGLSAYQQNRAAGQRDTALSQAGQAQQDLQQYRQQDLGMQDRRLTAQEQDAASLRDYRKSSLQQGADQLAESVRSSKAAGQRAEERHINELSTNNAELDAAIKEGRAMEQAGIQANEDKAVAAKREADARQFLSDNAAEFNIRPEQIGLMTGEEARSVALGGMLYGVNQARGKGQTAGSIGRGGADGGVDDYTEQASKLYRDRKAAIAPVRERHGVISRALMMATQAAGQDDLDPETVIAIPNEEGQFEEVTAGQAEAVLGQLQMQIDEGASSTSNERLDEDVRPRWMEGEAQRAARAVVGQEVQQRHATDMEQAYAQEGASIDPHDPQAMQEFLAGAQERGVNVTPESIATAREEVFRQRQTEMLQVEENAVFQAFRQQVASSSLTPNTLKWAMQQDYRMKALSDAWGVPVRALQDELHAFFANPISYANRARRSLDEHSQRSSHNLRPFTTMEKVYVQLEAGGLAAEISDNWMPAPAGPEENPYEELPLSGGSNRQRPPIAPEAQPDGFRMSQSLRNVPIKLRPTQKAQ